MARRSKAGPLNVKPREAGLDEKPPEEALNRRMHSDQYITARLHQPFDRVNFADQPKSRSMSRSCGVCWWVSHVVKPRWRTQKLSRPHATIYLGPLRYASSDPSATPPATPPAATTSDLSETSRSNRCGGRNQQPVQRTLPRRRASSRPACRSMQVRYDPSACVNRRATAREPSCRTACPDT